MSGVDIVARLYLYLLQQIWGDVQVQLGAMRPKSFKLWNDQVLKEAFRSILRTMLLKMCRNRGSACRRIDSSSYADAGMHD